MGNIKNILGENIRTLRTRKGWTQVYLAECLEITSPFLAQIESGRKGMSLELIEAVAGLFEVPIASLFLVQKSEQPDATAGIREVELRAVEKQLQEIVSENITKAFDRLR